MLVITSPTLKSGDSAQYLRQKKNPGGPFVSRSFSAFAAEDPSTEAPRVRRYLSLGRTGIEISDISFGSSRLRDPKAVRHAFERGINYSARCVGR
jgi:hypothetical protein